MLILALIVAVLTQDPPRIENGDKAPDFGIKNQKGEEIKLADFKGKKNVLLAFYPKDNTAG